MWKVERHGGRRGDTWRVILETDDALEAARRFDREKTHLRQGMVRLLENELMQDFYSAPCLRSRW